MGNEVCNMCSKDTAKPFYEVDNKAGNGVFNICLVCAGGALKAMTEESITLKAKLDEQDTLRIGAEYTVEILEADLAQARQDAVEMAKQLQKCARELFAHANCYEETVKECKKYGDDSCAIIDKYKEKT